jgi:DNA-binding NarL/FixJ family response regulator
MPIRLVLADDHPLILTALEEFLRLEPDLLVLATCRNGEQTLQAVRQHQPDVLLLDLRMPEGNGLKVLQAMHDEHLPGRVVVLTGAIDGDEILTAMRFGVCGVVVKDMEPQHILQCIRTVYAGGTWPERSSRDPDVEEFWQRLDMAHHLTEKLTAREAETVVMVTAYLSNKEIADKLFISEGTVKRHLHNIYEKLGVSSRLDLFRYVKENVS